MELVETKSENYYKLLKDSINISHKYPDGRYKVFLSDTNQLPLYVFNVNAGNIDGPFLELAKGAYTYGTYSQDSLWTFLSCPDDTTFKIGTWYSYYYALGSGREKIYKMLYDRNGFFIEV